MEGAITTKGGGFSITQIFILLGIFLLGAFLWSLFTKQTYTDSTGEVQGAVKTTPSKPGANPGTEATTQQRNKSARRGGRVR